MRRVETAVDHAVARPPGAREARFDEGVGKLARAKPVKFGRCGRKRELLGDDAGGPFVRARQIESGAPAGTSRTSLAG